MMTLQTRLQLVTEFASHQILTLAASQTPIIYVCGVQTILETPRQSLEHKSAPEMYAYLKEWPRKNIREHGRST